MNYPRITIITPSYNQGNYLEETIRSVLDQDYPNLEFFIIDGGSTDNSVEIIKKYEQKISYWVSEKDRGQTHAINKGFERSTGEIINWINSDDLLAPGALHKVAELFMEKQPLCICGMVTIFDENKSWPYPQAWSVGESLQSVIGRDSFNQPGTFFSREAVEGIGYPVENLNYIMDKEWFVRFLLRFGTERIAVSPDVFALHRYHDTSKTVSEGNKFLDEYAAIISSMADSIGETQFRGLLAEKYNFSKHPYRFSYSFSSLKPQLIHQMVAVLLIRRYYDIFKEEDFLFAKKFFSVIDRTLIQLDPELEKRLQIMEKKSNYSSWFTFRLARKLGLNS